MFNAKEYRHARYLAHREECIAYQKEYNKTHPHSYEKDRLYSKRYYQRHREMVKAKSLAYYYKRKAEQV